MRAQQFIHFAAEICIGAARCCQELLALRTSRNGLRLIEELDARSGSQQRKLGGVVML